MASKNAVVIFLNGGMDAINFITPTDATSVNFLQTYRQAAPANILDYTPNITKTGNLTANSGVITGINTTNLGVGQKVYGLNLPAQRGLEIGVIGANQITLANNAVAYVTSTATTLYFGNAGVNTFSSQLFKLNESNDTVRGTSAHWSQRFLWDTFNVPDTLANANKTKSAVMMCIGPLLKPLVKDTIGINAPIKVRLPNNTLIPSTDLDFPPFIQSHNDQQSTWQSSKTEGATLGTGGAIADKLLPNIPLTQNKPLISVTVASPLFATGSEATPLSVSQNGLVRKIPGVLGRVTQDTDSTLSSTLNSLFYQAMRAVPANDDFSTTVDSTSFLTQSFQTILSDDNISQMTDITAESFSIQTDGGAVYSSASLGRSLKTLLRMVLANNPNRGGIATRSGNVVTVVTEETSGVANRVSGSTDTTITSANHRLFTSNNSANTTDSVIVIGNPTAIDTSISPDGYKITLDPSDVNNKFTFTSTSTTALVNVPVKIKLKHNFSSANTVFIKSTDAALSLPDPYAITVINSTSFSFTTIQTGAFTPTANLPIKFKLIDLPNQIMFADVGGWDSHGEPNHSQLAALNAALTYYNRIVERIEDADTVTLTMSEFGRNVSTNSKGTDHGYGGHQMVFGKSVRGNKVYGTIPSIDFAGPNIFNNQLLPAISVSQYMATVAKWLGLTDAQILQVFPDLLNWPANERNLGFLDPLV